MNTTRGAQTTPPTAQWIPAPTDLADSRIAKFSRFAGTRYGLEMTDYDSLYCWSVTHLDDFWRAIAEFFDVPVGDGPVRDGESMPRTRWFPDAKLNYVDRLTAMAWRSGPAIAHTYENGTTTTLSWPELIRQVSALANTLREHGIGVNDRVAGYLPNIPEAIISFLATASLGAIWSVCGQEYSPTAALGRLGQIEPHALIVANGYDYAGRPRD